MGAPKGHPPYPGCETGGRPVEWTDERIEAEADALLEWIKNPKNVWFKRFCFDRDLPVEWLSRFAKKNKKFEQAYKKAVQNQEFLLFNSGWDKTKDTTMSIFALKCNHGWVEGSNTTGLEEETETKSSRAIADTKETCIVHANAVEQASNKPSQS